MKINSNTYWDSRFNADWEAKMGPGQSRFFARIAIGHLPEWLMTQLRKNASTLVDWGCAQGDGTDEWASYLSARQLTGIDFSSVAIDQATQRYPAIKFFSEDWLSDSDKLKRTYDFVFSSNVIEHFHQPYDILKIISEKARKGVLLLLPYRERDRHDEHFFTFLPENIPLVLPNRFRLIWAKVINCSGIDNTHWTGEQVVLAYADTTWLDCLGLALRDCLVEHEDLNFEKARLRASLAERDIQLADLNLANLQRERELHEKILVMGGGFHEAQRAAIEKTSQQQTYHAAEISCLQVKLQELQDRLLASEHTTKEQIKTYAERERELQEVFREEQKKLFMLERELLNRSRERELVHAAERKELQARIDYLQEALLSVEREKGRQAVALTEQVQNTTNAHAERERAIAEQLRKAEDSSRVWQSAAKTLQIELDSILSSKYWRATAVLRKLIAWKRSAGHGTNEISGVSEEILTMNNDYVTPAATVIRKVEDLLGLYGGQFVSEAYRALLGRPPDEQGYIYYLGRLRRGIHKLRILDQISKSHEAKKFGAKIIGMNSAIIRHTWSHLPFLRLMQPDHERIDCRLSRIENRLFELGEVQFKRSLAESQELKEKQKLGRDNEGASDSRLDHSVKEESRVCSRVDDSLLADDLIIITGVPFDDVGGGQRAAQLARAALRTGRRVIYLYIYKKYDFSREQYVDSAVDILSLIHAHVDDLSPAQLLERVSGKSTLVVELPHPKILPYLEIAKARELRTVFELIDDWETSLGGDWFDREIYARFALESDIVVGTAQLLVQRLVEIGREDARYLPNAANELIFDRYKTYTRPDDLPKNGKRIALYFGSLYGEWFAWDYVIAAGLMCNDLDIVLIGDSPKKTDLPANIHCLGPKRIEELPSYLSFSDMALLPFVPGKITDAVSPIKVFEYLFMGKPVISTDIPEIASYPGVRTAKSAEHFATMCASGSQEPTFCGDDNFIAQNSWFARLDSITESARNPEFKGSVSAIVLIHNNIDIVGRCIETLLRHGKYFLNEIIVVDNASTDGGGKYVEERYPLVRLIRNTVNGCASGRNLASTLATGKFLAFFDSDQWLTSSSCFSEALSILAQDASIGAVGWAAGWFDQSRSDLAGVIADYLPNRGMNAIALERGYRDDIGYLGTGGLFLYGKTFGALDGFDTFYDPTCFEDTDLSFQIKKLGLKICYRDLTGIRHQPHQTTGAGHQSDSYRKLFERNSNYFKSKWQAYPEFFLDYLPSR